MCILITLDSAIHFNFLGLKVIVVHKTFVFFFFFFCSRLEQNLIKSIPPGAFSPYKKLKRM